MLLAQSLSKLLLQWPVPSSLKQSTQLHAQMVVSGAIYNPLSLSHLLKSITDCSEAGSLTYALNMFARIPSPSAFMWNSIIRACSRNHFPRESIHFFQRMLHKGVPPDSYTFQCLFKSCSLSSSFLEGQMAHGVFIRLFPESDSLVANSLIHMYLEFGWVDDARRAFSGTDRKDVVSWTTFIGGLVKSGFLDEARRLFDEMPERNVISWTSMITGNSQAGRAEEAVQFFKRMLSDGVVPDAVTVISVLSACAQMRDLELGKWLHQFLAKENIAFNSNLIVALIDMYSKCGDICSARQVFDSIGWKVLQAWNAIIDGYCKMGKVDIARSLFDQMNACDIISLNSMITGYIQNSRLKEALLLFGKLCTSGLRPDKYTVVGLLTACASLGALGQGKLLHAYIEVGSVEWDVYLGTALLDMYAKCGKLDQAMLVFQRMDERDLRAWTAIISGLAMNGMGELALKHFSLMKKEGIRPNAVAYIGVLTSCSHSGLMAEGRKYFEEMKALYNIEPEIEHYGCMVDLLGRAGHLKEAVELIKSMPMEPNAVIWGSILSACRVYKDIDLAEKAAKHLLDLEPHEDAVYVQLYNIYVDSKRWADASNIRSLMEKKGVRKMAAYSSITLGGQVHRFIAGDQSHPEIMEIQVMMSEMAKKLKLAGYMPITSQISVDVDEEEKELALFSHSEKMAIAFGLMRLGANMPIHVIKNLRICEDCHLAIKMISKIWSRDIVVRDRSRFHHFQDGHCSCSDFW
ncbi:pentatricopeptide repeat-containing protein At3g62890-like [Elaeis guineensis]|uniref:Pentatricopeptide repeat-containing protein At3g62890-like n=1 Tax=Elaeis guineensis var. tenera TaxID=51953 RepID=A0A6I9R582_ELAGV|nr:pentatricopeptide repeat-containing protein At3g62890-like [Elaeis guineensis]